MGTHSLTLKYLGDGNHAADEGTVSVTVVKASSSVSGTAADITWGHAGSVSVTVTPSAATGTVELYDGATKLGEGTLDGRRDQHQRSPRGRWRPATTPSRWRTSVTPATRPARRPSR